MVWQDHGQYLYVVCWDSIQTLAKIGNIGNALTIVKEGGEGNEKIMYRSGHAADAGMHRGLRRRETEGYS